MPNTSKIRRLSLAVLLGSALLSGCAPLLVGGAVGGALMATDRRTSGTQLEDEGIEFKARARLREKLGGKTHININAYNRFVLLTGEVNTEAERERAQAVVAEIENVKRVGNEIEVGFLSSLGSRSNDVLLSTKIKASLVDAPELQSNAFDVVVERGNVYMLGRVTEREAARAVDVTRGVAGVKKVVRMFELISEEELARIAPKPNKPNKTTPSK